MRIDRNKTKYIHYMMYTTLIIPVSAYPIKKKPTYVLFFIVIEFSFTLFKVYIIFNEFYNICQLIK